MHDLLTLDATEEKNCDYAVQGLRMVVITRNIDHSGQ